MWALSVITRVLREGMRKISWRDVRTDTEIREKRCYAPD